ncbi:MAG: hypothetical protein ACREDE_09275 [Thermoplasmata archaeon]
MPSLPSVPTPCCDHCVPEHRGEWELRPNPYLLHGDASPPCAFCGEAVPASILTIACPLGEGSRPR